MFQLVRRSIRLKFMLVVIATTFVALLVMAVALVLWDAQRYRTASAADLVTQADLVGQASAAALVFDDPGVAQQNLELLRSRPRILAAAIFAANGAPFASYAQNPQEVALPVRPGPEGAVVAGDRMMLFRPILDADGRVGTVYIVARYELMDRIRTYLAILAAAMVIGLLVAAIMSYWMQAAVTNPVLSIARVARHVQQRRDLSLRAPHTGDDEIGALAETFNEMIEEVGARTGELERANRSLEQEMATRREAEQALRLADRRKDEFLATLAHELRNPLAPLRTALEILRLQPDDGPAGRSALEIMNRQLVQLVRLVDDLLDVSRITTGKLKLRPEATELHAIVQSALDAAGPFISQSGVQLAVEVPEDPVELCVDGTRIAQVLQNLLHNAAKFTERGGHVALRAAVEGDTLVLEVEDDGIGIAAEQLPQIFEMFEQVDRSLERRHSGLGVGLSLSRRLVELHGGTLEAHSAGLGRGSRFTVRLPRTGASPAAERGAAHEPHPAVRPRRVLLVDDNRDFAGSLGLLLRRHGYEVRVAHDGEDALRAAREFEPEVAFLDIGMPRMNGYDLARTLRAERPRLLLVAVTGWGQDSDRERALRSGFDHHLVKPVDLARIERLLAGTGDQPALRP